MLLIIRGDGDGDMDCIGDQEPYAKDNHANQRAPEAANRIFIFVLLNINISCKNNEIAITWTRSSCSLRRNCHLIAERSE